MPKRPRLTETRVPRTKPQLRLIEVQLGEDLAEFLTQERAAGRSWPAITEDLIERTGVSIDDDRVRVFGLQIGLS